MRISPTSDGRVGDGARGDCGRSTSSTLPYPGIATDYKPLFVAMLAVADGVGIVTENLFSGRFRYVDELVRMGADIRTEGHHAVVRGVRAALGRAGARPRHPGRRRARGGRRSAAEGETVITDAHHIDRGYEDFVGKLRGRSAPTSCASARSTPDGAIGTDVRRAARRVALRERHEDQSCSKPSTPSARPCRPMAATSRSSTSTRTRRGRRRRARGRLRQLPDRRR